MSFGVSATDLEMEMQVANILIGADVRPEDVPRYSRKPTSSGTSSKARCGHPHPHEDAMGMQTTSSGSMSQKSSVDSTSSQRHLVSVSGLVKCGKPLGLYLQCNSGTLLVRGVYDGGAVAEWNKSALYPAHVCKNDLILSVNGVSGDAEEMRHTICEQSKLNLVISRDIDEDEFLTVTV